MGMFLTAIAVAAAFWGPTPCNLATPGPVCEPHVYVQNLPTYKDEHGFPIFRVLGRFEGSPQGFPVILVDSGHWQWRRLCTVLLHESGHAHGLQHTKEPGLMNPVLDDYVAPACVGRRPPQYPPGAFIVLRARDNNLEGATP